MEFYSVKKNAVKMFLKKFNVKEFLGWKPYAEFHTEDGKSSPKLCVNSYRQDIAYV